ncbi:T9SS type A sorting domain-containing protein [Chryseobacterium sp.]|uniref:T9SS type A sorting domain-containing protein n=1 Tax=Chryseobacterium sp. TaxID=1871047 RepID=UPI001B13044F|nr:T9SS type A sorting domain-containing protein [Chryseobacterium sp.]MBO9692932.1 T9SS type A sorting domain-containing protein [Chryseobacterium sp.]
MRKIFILSSLFSVAVISAQVGTTCQNPIIITSLPYTTTDNTANYADNYDPSTSSSPSCSDTTMGNFFHTGNDVIYSYTAAASGTIKLEIPASAATGWTGMFVYNSCSDIGVNYAACDTIASTAAPIIIDNFPVVAGQTYYILISSWSDPQTVSYTLNVTSLTLGINDINLKKEKTIIYPNPTGKEIYFKHSKNIEFATIYSIDGKKIQSFKVNNNMVSVEHFIPGNYIIEFVDKAGNKSTQTFIKK